MSTATKLIEETRVCTNDLRDDTFNAFKHHQHECHVDQKVVRHLAIVVPISRQFQFDFAQVRSRGRFFENIFHYGPPS